jgi:2-(3-amino-3-carboxypropyl)histidine synthase
VKIHFVNAVWKEEISLGKEIIDYLNKEKPKTIALFASVQFLKLDKVKNQLKDLSIDIKTTKASRASEEGQILGCDIYEDNFDSTLLKECDKILYIGDGMFHPQALLYAQVHQSKAKEIIIWNPLSKKMKIINEDEILKNVNKMKANVSRYLISKSIGILVTTKPGQYHMNRALALKEKVEKKGRKAYIFIGDVFDSVDFENFNFIEAWVNTACPRIGTDDILKINKPLINIKDALNPEKALVNLFGGKDANSK